jgi:hypothetical protein
MPSYLYRAPAGIPGSITRVDETVVEPGYLAAANFPTAFGQPVKISSGKFVLMGALLLLISTALYPASSRPSVAAVKPSQTAPRRLTSLPASLPVAT